MASFTYVPPEPPKFVKDPLEIDDIDGTRTRKEREFVPRPSSTATTQLIEGAQVKGPYVRKQAYDSIGYNDVYAKKAPSQRVTNPLNPQYMVRDTMTTGEFPKGKVGEPNSMYGEIPGSRPLGLPKPVQGTRNLHTADIEGASPNSKNLGNFANFQRRQVRDLMEVHDIDGTTCGTVKRGIVTKRAINPLDPAYQIPGNTENTSEINDPYGMKGCSMTKHKVCDENKSQNLPPKA